MNRREFLKTCSLMAVAGILFGCRKIGDVPNVPNLSLFEDEVRRAIALNKKKMELVQIPIPKALKEHGDFSNRFGMAIDLDACDGCGKCILACNLENNVPMVTKERADQGRFMHWIEMREGGPFMCAHCSDAPCEKVCPTGAASHTPDGLSFMMYKRCTGSRFCGANCPAHARKFNYDDAQKLGLSRQFNKEVPLREKGVMEKCSLCVHRLQNDRLRFKTEKPTQTWRGKDVNTACAESCPKKAIVFGNWLDEESDLVKVATSRKLYTLKALSNFDPSIVFMMGRR
ncbi:MAG: 4Fe-4S dicluster domain-containing protein [Fibrobacter sp.]|nr:4Fe-4S dicluster domain-containing protein [Fibrobacter sp.]